MDLNEHLSAYYEGLLADIRDFQLNNPEPINAFNFELLITKTAEMVENYSVISSIKGEQKTELAKAVVMRLAYQLQKEGLLDDASAEIIQGSMDIMGTTIFAVAVKAASGGIDINKKEKKQKAKCIC